MKNTKTRKFLSKTISGFTIFNIILAQVLLGVFVFTNTAWAARTINSVTLNGGSNVTVLTDANITAVMNVTTDGSGNEDDWKSTGWRISTNPFSDGSTGCETGPTFSSSGPHSDTFTISAPSAAGTYNAYFIAYNDNSCSSGASATYTLSGAVIVNEPRITVSATLNDSANVTVAPGANITAAVTGTITGDSSGDWRRTEWLIDTTPPGSMDCKNTIDYNDAGTFSSGNFNINAPSLPGVYNAYFRINGGSDDCSSSQRGTLLTLTNAVTVTGPDLTATKTNNLNGGNAIVGIPFNWIITVTNSGTASATFGKDKVILVDNMPFSGVSSYGVVSVSASAGVTGLPGNLTCSQNGTNDRDLTCRVINTTGKTITIPVGDYIAFSVTTTPTATGPLFNPRNKCQVDPNTELDESDETNNNCSNSVTVAPPNHAPVASNQNITTYEDITKDIVLSATDADGNPLTYSIVTDPSHGILSAIDPLTYTVTYTPDSNYNGLDSFTFKAYDGHDYSNEATVSITVNSVNDPPVISSVSITPTNPKTNDTLTANVTAHDADQGDTISYTYQWKKNGSDVGENSSTFDLSIDGNGDKNDEITVSIIASDDHGSVTEPVTSDAITILNTPPVAESQGVEAPLGAGEDNPLQITLTGSDADGDYLTYSIISDPTNGEVILGEIPGSAIYTPYPDFNGSDLFTFQAYDEQDCSNEATVYIDVNPENDSPVIDTINNEAVGEDPISFTIDELSPFSFTVTASDVDGDVISYSLSDLKPADASIDFSTGVFNWTPTEVQGPDTYTFDIIVSDGNEGTDAKTITIVVNEVNTAPIIDSILDSGGHQPPFVVSELSTLVFTVTASDADGNSSLNYSLIGEPTGASIDSSTGVFSWTPTEAQGPAEYTFDITVSDGNDGTDSETITITVSDLARISGYKWKDLNVDGLWQRGKDEENREPGISGWNIDLYRIVPDTNELEKIASAVTDSDGKFLFNVDAPALYRIVEEVKEKWQKTSTADFFDVSVESKGQDITQDINSNDLQFGNIYYENVLGGKFAPSNGDGNATPNARTLGDTVIEIPQNSGTSTISIPDGTVISRTDGENMSVGDLSAGDVSPSSLSGLGTGVIVDGALQWGITNLGLQFDKPITLSIFLGNSFNGQTLNIVRSTSGSDGWTNDGIVPPATCVVSDGLCTFQATKASYYASTHNATSGGDDSDGNSGGGGGGGGGGNPAPLELTIYNESKTSVLETSITINWTTSYDSTSQIIYAAEGETHTLNLLDYLGNPPLYGYAHTTPEYDTASKTMNHSVTITGLVAGTTYYYRTISHGSLAVGQESTFTTTGTKLAPVQSGIVTEEETSAGAGENLVSNASTIANLLEENTLEQTNVGIASVITNFPANNNGLFAEQENPTPTNNANFLAITLMTLKEISGSAFFLIAVIILIIALVGITVGAIRRSRPGKTVSKRTKI